jgi:hypothetical protein
VEDVAEVTSPAAGGAVVADEGAKMLDTLQPWWHWDRRRLKERRGCTHHRYLLRFVVFYDIHFPLDEEHQTASGWGW